MRDGGSAHRDERDRGREASADRERAGEHTTARSGPRELALRAGGSNGRRGELLMCPDRARRRRWGRRRLVDHDDARGRRTDRERHPVGGTRGGEPHERITQLDHRAVALRRVLLEAVPDDLVVLLRDVRIEDGRPDGLVVVNLQRDVADAFAVERELSGRELVEDDPERPDVASYVGVA